MNTARAKEAAASLVFVHEPNDQYFPMAMAMAMAMATETNSIRCRLNN